MGVSRADEARRQQAEQYRQGRTYAANEVGYHASRGCTDLLGILLYLVGFAAMMMVAVVAYSNGDPERLLYGVDRQGYLCGHEYAGNIPPEFNLTTDNGTALRWADMDVIVYPLPSVATCAERLVSTSGPTCEDLIADTMKMGICWYQCPDAGEHITWYNGQDDVNGTTFGFDVVLDTRNQLNRCMPKQTDVLVDNLGDLFGAAGSINAEFAELRDSLDIIAITLCGTIVFCFVWLLILRYAVKPLVYLSMLILYVVSAALIYITYSNWSRSVGGTTKTVWLVFFLATALWGFVYTCLIVFFCKNVAIACDCIEEASRIPRAIPSMMVIPPVVVICLIPVAAFHILVWVYLYTAGDIEYEKVLQYTNITDPLGAMGAVNQVTVRAVQTPGYETYAQIFNVFMFFWSMNFWISCGYMIVAFCGVFWYWSCPGDSKSPQGGVMTGICWTVRYHLGTLFLGSLLVAIVQTIRFVMTRIEDQLRKMGDHATMNCIISCIHCCLACLERLIKFVNNNAYIMTCMCSDNFCRGARRAIFLLLSNATSVMLVKAISTWVLLFSKLMICAGAGAIAYALVVEADLDGADKSIEDSIMLLVVVIICAYVIASVFVNVFATCIDVVVLSFCYDLDVNNGMDKPYFLPDDLQRTLKAKNQPSYHKPNFGEMPQLQGPSDGYARF